MLPASFQRDARPVRESESKALLDVIEHRGPSPILEADKRSPEFREREVELCLEPASTAFAQCQSVEGQSVGQTGRLASGSSNEQIRARL
jgi:hypothetical protein